ncbi:sulfate adenylyltransferase subunit CysN [Aurantimonas sp. Leaf443]|uniref:sulfate adenylyltransferase subunit CysN n=1 Tax=Aurantimonas sp. Leaf443 TaxID=1736378 RepID=UPI0006F6A36D|nr:sulfate adenylyltransferase subunit CysN [Aurantimonas sp. Leaf443]KQT87441.1 sulfate adenylyltransferase [Aurantimonas sp. Leaf443]
MTSALAPKPSPLDPASAPAAAGSPSPAVLAEDARFAGPAPDGGAIVDPQAHMAPLVSPAASLLRFITCGSVDDGKSTLIGRLLYETGAVYEDQLEALTRDSRKFGTTGADLDFALLVDGLSAEREQGITIDVAYRYFSTANRAFIIADTPGHEQYTRNMATGASQAELAIILVDARKGILPQTRRHSFIASLVGIKSIVVAVNKMDLVEFSQERFEAIQAGYRAILPGLGFTDVAFIPLSAKNGDNITTRSANTPWYEGETLLGHLETATPQTFDAGAEPFRLPVQWVNRPNLDFRGFSGTIVGGRIAKGAAITVLPSGRRSSVAGLYGPDGWVDEAGAGEAVTLTLADEVDVSRGDVLVADGDTAAPQRQVVAEILWMVDRPLVAGGRLVAKLGSAQTPATVRTLDESVDIHSYERRPANTLLMNEIGRVTLAFERPPVATRYEENRELGSLILIDPLSNETVALGVVRETGVAPVQDEAAPVPAAAQEGALSGLAAIWYGALAPGGAKWRRAVLRSRAFGSLFVAFVASLFGLPLLLALLMGAIDFAVRPFIAYLVLGGEVSSRISTDPSSGRDGEGI